MIGQLEQYFGLLITVASALGAIGLIWAVVYKPARRHFQRVNSGMDTLLGYPAVKDPGSGREIQPATPPLAARVYDLEDTNKRMVDALVVIADNQRVLLDLERKYEEQRVEMDERRIRGERVIADFTAWRGRVDDKLRTWVGEQDELAKVIKGQLAKDEKEGS